MTYIHLTEVEFRVGEQKARIGWRVDRKFSKMVELLGPQNRKMVKLLGVKFAQKGLFFKSFAAPLAPRPILSFRMTLYIKFDHIRHLLSKFRHFRKIFTKMRFFF